jgi:hypothetical protein
VQERDTNNLSNNQLYHTQGKNRGEPKTNNLKLRENLLEAIEREGYDIKVDDLTIAMLSREDGLAKLKL